MITRIERVPVSELLARGVVADTTPLRTVVLVVDDEPIIADTIVAILNHHGYAASAAYSGESALRMARIVPPSLLITDVSMPGMNGIELAVAVTTAIRDCKALLFSGHAATHDLLNESRADGHEFTLLQKPVHPKDLLVEVSNLLASSPMTTRRGVGCVCRCGAPIWLWDTQMETNGELAELRGWKRQDAWTRIVVHSPQGCGERMVVNADDLILLEKACVTAEPSRPHASPFLI